MVVFRDLAPLTNQRRGGTPVPVDISEFEKDGGLRDLPVDAVA
jgi:hypothetical protein